jgi:hypothetical protein
MPMRLGFALIGLLTAAAFALLSASPPESKAVDYDCSNFRTRLKLRATYCQAILMASTETTMGSPASPYPVPARRARPLPRLRSLRPHQNRQKTESSSTTLLTATPSTFASQTKAQPPFVSSGSTPRRHNDLAALSSAAVRRPLQR